MYSIYYEPAKSRKQPNNQLALAGGRLTSQTTRTRRGGHQPMNKYETNEVFGEIILTKAT